VLGGTEIDTVSYGRHPTAVVVDLAAGTATGAGSDTITTTEGVEGGFGDDTITGNFAANSMSGGPGDDTISGLGGNDVIRGSTGDDTMNGGFGTDTATFANTGGPIDADLTAGTATGDGSDTITLFENVVGSLGSDTLVGTSGPNVIDGSDGTDTCIGNGGADTLLNCP
jgi:Ca2+-binding RTX toxin-like protein